VVVDPVEQVPESTATQWQVPHIADVESLIALPQLDAAYIATPTDLHAVHTRMAANAGHVRQSRDGASLYTAKSREDIFLPIPSGSQDMVIQQYRTPAGRRAPVHDGGWALANPRCALLRWGRRKAVAKWRFSARLPCRRSSSQAMGDHA